MDYRPQEPIQPPTASEDAGAGFDIRALLRVLYKYKWGIVGLSLLTAVLAGLWVFNQVHIYRATSVLLIEREAPKFVSLDDIYGASAAHWEYYQTQYEILRSRPIAERVARRLGLPGPAPVATPRAAEGWRSLLPEGWFPEPQPPSEEDRWEGTVSGIQNGIIVTPVRNSQLVRISTESSDPAEAVRRANAVVDAYIAEDLEGRLQMTQTASNWLMERLQTLKEKLDESEMALQTFREQESLIDVGGVGTLPAQELALTTTNLAEAREERAEKEAALEQIRRARASGASMAAIPAVLSDLSVQRARQDESDAESTVQELGTRYGPLHPKMITAQRELESAREVLTERVNTVASSIEADYRTALSAEQQLAAQLGSIKDDAQVISRKQNRLRTLEREVEQNRQLYELFQTQFKEVDASGGVQTANARVIEYASTPKTPVRPNRKRTVMVGFVLGLLLSIGLAFLLDHLDATLKGQEDVERRLGLPVLGLLPLLKTEHDKDLSPIRHFSENTRSTFSEAIRTIRTSVLLSAIDTPHKIVLVTSSMPGEGKTTLATNLAHALGQMKSVLLIDADMRRPMVGKAMAKGNKPIQKGLSDVISGEAKFAECVRSVDNSELKVLSSGTIPPNPLEILSSKRFSEALQQMSSHFDHIVIDCAPALAVSDALVLSKMASAVVYVVRSDRTPYKLAQTGVGRLRRVNANLIGAVVNRVVARSARYGKYSGYYQYDQYYADYGYHTRS